MVNFLSPGLKVREKESAIRNIRGVATSIGSFVGLAIKGPIGEPTLITSLEDFVDIFGGPTSNSVLFYAVQGFYINAGEGAPLYITRTAHYTTISDASSLTAVKGTKTLVDRAGTPVSTLKIDAKTEGKWGNKLQITTENSSLLQTETLENIANGGTSVLVKNPAGIRIGSLLTIDDGTDDATVVVTDVDGQRIYFAAVTLSAAIDAGASVVDVSFNLLVYQADQLVETWENLSMIDANTKNYVEVIINDVNTGSRYIKATDLDSASAPLLSIPALVTKSVLASGADGLSGLTDGDYVGSAASDTGLYSFDKIQVINMIAIPDSQTNVVQLGVIDYCELRKHLFGVLDSPRGLSITGAATYVKDTLAANTSRASFYYPQVKVFDPDSNSTIIVPASGHIMGIYARVDAEIGIQQVGAGETGQIRGIVGFEHENTQKEGNRDILYQARIVPLANIDGLGRCIFGSITLSRTGGIGSQINERRIFNFVGQSLEIGLKFILFKNNTPQLRSNVDSTIRAFLVPLKKDGVLDDFEVDVGEGLNNALVRAQGKLVILVSLKAPDTIEFVDLIMAKDTRAIEAALAA